MTVEFEGAMYTGARRARVTFAEGELCLERKRRKTTRIPLVGLGTLLTFGQDEPTGEIPAGLTLLRLAVSP